MTPNPASSSHKPASFTQSSSGSPGPNAATNANMAALQQEFEESMSMVTEKETEYGQLLASVVQIERDMSDAEGCSCVATQENLTTLLHTHHRLRDVTSTTARMEPEAELASLRAQNIDLEKRKTSLKSKLMTANKLAADRQDELDNLNEEVLRTAVRDLQRDRDTLQAEAENLNVQRTDLGNEVQNAQKQLDEIHAAIGKFQNCRKQAEALEFSQRQRENAIDMLANREIMIIKAYLDQVRMKRILEEYEIPDVDPPKPSNSSEVIGSLKELTRSDLPLSSRTDVDMIAIDVIWADNQQQDNNLKRNFSGNRPDSAPVARKIMRTSQEIADACYKVEGWIESRGQAKLSHRTQALALQAMVAVNAINPLLTKSGPTGIISLSDEGIKEYQRRQKHQFLLRNSSEYVRELSKRFTPKVRETLRSHGFHKAGNLFIKRLADFVEGNVGVEPQIDRILAHLRQALAHVEIPCANLRRALITLMAMRRTDRIGQEFVDFVDELKVTIIRPLFSVYVSESSAASEIDPTLLKHLKCSEAIGGNTYAWRQQVCKSIKWLINNYDSLHELKREIELEWRPAYLLSDDELREVETCPQHTGTVAPN